MGTLIAAVAVAVLFFMFPVAVVLGGLGLWIGGGAGATIGAVIGLFIESAAL